ARGRRGPRPGRARQGLLARAPRVHARRRRAVRASRDPHDPRGRRAPADSLARGASPPAGRGARRRRRTSACERDGRPRRARLPGPSAARVRRAALFRRPDRPGDLPRARHRGGDRQAVPVRRARLARGRPGAARGRRRRRDVGGVPAGPPTREEAMSEPTPDMVLHEALHAAAHEAGAAALASGYEVPEAAVRAAARRRRIVRATGASVLSLGLLAGAGVALAQLSPEDASPVASSGRGHPSCGTEQLAEVFPLTMARLTAEPRRDLRATVGEDVDLRVTLENAGRSGEQLVADEGGPV